MAGYTYPVAAPSGTLTPAEVHALLANPNRIARRVRTLADQKFLADYLLAGRYVATGGAILYETGEEIFAADDPRAVQPGAEYPMTVLTSGELAAAKTTKWGIDSEVYDEAIARMGLNPVDKGLQKLVNSTVRIVDRGAMSVVASKVTRTIGVGAFSSGAAIVEGVLAAKATIDGDAEGYDADTVVLTPLQHAKVMGYLVTANLLPRENGNPVVSGTLPADALGVTWVTSPNWTSANPLVCDRDQLGGMADEDLQSPGYSRSSDGVGVETKVIRLTGEDDRDGYRIRARRVTTPVVTDPNAAAFLTGTGL